MSSSLRNNGDKKGWSWLYGHLESDLNEIYLINLSGSLSLIPLPPPPASISLISAFLSVGITCFFWNGLSLHLGNMVPAAPRAMLTTSWPVKQRDSSSLTLGRKVLGRFLIGQAEVMWPGEGWTVNAAAFTGPMPSSEVRGRVCDWQTRRTRLSVVGSWGREFPLRKLCAVPGQTR